MISYDNLINHKALSDAAVQKICKDLKEIGG
jgi:hypothetical protein